MSRIYRTRASLDALTRERARDYQSAINLRARSVLDQITFEDALVEVIAALEKSGKSIRKGKV